jgi:hypothetical protein
MKQDPARSALKDARLLRKLGKRLGLKQGATAAHIIAALEALMARGTTPRVDVPMVAGKIDLPALLEMVSAMLPVARDVAKSGKLPAVALTPPMQAFKGAAMPRSLACAAVDGVH